MIEDSFSAKKAGAVYVELITAYDNVWYRGLIYKPLRLLPHKHMELVGNHSFMVTTGSNKRNRLRCLQNGVS